MALALSPQPSTRPDHAARSARVSHAVRADRPARPVVAPIATRSPQKGLTLSTECRTRRNNEVRARYLAEARARQHKVYLRRRIAAAIMVISIAAAACLGVRALASRGDGSASLPTVTPRGSTVLFTAQGAVSSASTPIDVSGAFIQGSQVYVVQAGDTLWSIASSLTDGSVRSYVNELIELNGSASVDVGQRLVLPAD